MTIRCENEFCVFYENDTCTEDSFEVDVMGFCAHLFPVGMDKNYLDMERKKMRERFEKAKRDRDRADDPQ